MSFVPGDPVELILPQEATYEQKEALRAEMGLDQPLYVQFFKYIWNALHGDFGTSYSYNRSVMDLIMESFPNTVKLAVLAALFAWGVGVVAGIVAAIHPNKFLDHLFMGTALIGVSMPVFMTALFLQYAFAFKLKIFPLSGMQGIKYYILPAVALGWNSAGSIARMTRSNLMAVMQEDYISTARAKGRGNGGTILFHALRNSMVLLLRRVYLALQVSDSWQ